MKRRGFTLIELMTVVTVLAILLTIVVTTATGSIQSSRAQRTQAMCTLLETGLETYKQQYGKFPDPLGSKIEDGTFGNSESDTYELSSEEVRRMVYALVAEAKNGNPMIDVSQLFVAGKNNELRGNKPQNKVTGLSFFDAVHGQNEREYRNRMRVSDMFFGYQHKETGYFLRFKMVYSIPAEKISVMQQ